MKRTFLSAALVAALSFSAGTAQAASFTYHGSLQDSGKPADGNYDIELGGDNHLCRSCCLTKECYLMA